MPSGQRLSVYAMQLLSSKWYWSYHQKLKLTYIYQPLPFDVSIYLSLIFNTFISLHYLFSLVTKSFSFCLIKGNLRTGFWAQTISQIQYEHLPRRFTNHNAHTCLVCKYSYTSDIQFRYKARHQKYVLPCRKSLQEYWYFCIILFLNNRRVFHKTNYKSLVGNFRPAAIRSMFS